MVCCHRWVLHILPFSCSYDYTAGIINIAGIRFDSWVGGSEVDLKSPTGWQEMMRWACWRWLGPTEVCGHAPLTPGRWTRWWRWTIQAMGRWGGLPAIRRYALQRYRAPNYAPPRNHTRLNVRFSDGQSPNATLGLPEKIFIKLLNNRFISISSYPSLPSHHCSGRISIHSLFLTVILCLHCCQVKH